MKAEGELILWCDSTAPEFQEVAWDNWTDEWIRFWDLSIFVGYLWPDLTNTTRQ